MLTVVLMTDGLETLVGVSNPTEVTVVQIGDTPDDDPVLPARLHDPKAVWWAVMQLLQDAFVWVVAHVPGMATASFSSELERGLWHMRHALVILCRARVFTIVGDIGCLNWLCWSPAIDSLNSLGAQGACKCR
jgi:hypothetical protein